MNTNAPAVGAVSSSIIVRTTGFVPDIVVPDTLLKVKVTVLSPSYAASSATKTVNVLAVASPSSQLRVPPAEV